MKIENRNYYTMTSQFRISDCLFPPFGKDMSHLPLEQYVDDLWCFF